MRRYIFLGCVIMLVSACSKLNLYKGDQRQLDEVTVINPSILVQRGTIVTEVEITQVNDGELIDTTSTVEMLPGLHNIKLTFSNSSYSSWKIVGTKTIELNMRAGHYYSAYGLILPRKFTQWHAGPIETDSWVWVEDFETGEIVWGKRPDALLDTLHISDVVTIPSDDWREYLRPTVIKRKCAPIATYVYECQK